MSRCVQVSSLRLVKNSQGVVYPLSSFTDEELEIFLNMTVLLFEKVCNTKFSLYDETWLFDGTGTDILRLPPTVYYPLVSVSGTVDIIDDAENVEAAYTENMDFVKSAHYLQKTIGRSDRPRIRAMVGSESTWLGGTRNVRISGRFGQSCPAPIARAISLFTIETLLPGATGLHKNEIASESWPDYSVSYRSDKGKGERPSLFGFLEIDRLVRPYLGMSTFVMAGMYGATLVSSVLVDEIDPSVTGDSILKTSQFAGVTLPSINSSDDEIIASIRTIASILKGNVV